MKIPRKTCTNPELGSLGPWCTRLMLGALLLSLGLLSPVLGDTVVRTVGGGRLSSKGADAGFTDGDLLQASQFNTPFGCAVDSAGRVYVADRDNGALRRLDLAANRCRTLLQGLNQPIAVAVDRTEVIYVLTQGDGLIHKLDRGVPGVLSSRLFMPTAVAYDGDQSLFVTQNDGTVVRVNLANESVSAPLLTGLNQPGGIAVLDTGFLAISETAGHLIRIWDPRNGSVQRQIGTGISGFADGPATRASFNQPCQLAKAPGGGLIVADRGNHRVRQIHADTFVTTLYGVDPATWEGPACATCDPMILPGWLDATAEFAEARDPVGVAVSADGKVYTTETFYHLVREITGATFGFGGEGGNTNSVALPPSIAPNCGYYPMGRVITVSNPNSSSFLPTAVFYTTDGSEPTTNSFRVDLEDGLGSVIWREKQRDLTWLRLKAFVGNNASAVVSGQPVTAAEIGVPQDTTAGVGSTAIIPVVLNLRTNEQLKSLQFRVEVTPESASIPMIPETFEPLSVSTNDLITVVTSDEDKGAAEFRAAQYQIDRTRGAAITFIGTNSNFSVKNFAVVAMLAVPIPPDAPVGSRYLVEVLNASGTADAAQSRVPLTSMPPRFITVAHTGYLVGDSSPATWYTAIADGPGAIFSGFGDGILDNSDVNNVFTVALGTQVPYANTDLFDAMDAFPEDTVSSAGGDGLIRFLDWQIVLLRSLGLDLARWERSWSEGGLRLPRGAAPSGAANLPGQMLTSPPPGAVWTRQATLSGQVMEHAVPGTLLDLPVYVQVAPGYQIAGLAFRATVHPEGTAPALDRPVRFIPNPNLAAPNQNLVPSLDTVLCGWPLVPSSSFDPPLRGANLLGHVRVSVPATARREHVYTLRFSNADGSPDLQTQYEFETRPASLWVLSSALRAPETMSDEWKLHFFSSITSEAAFAAADPDQDGVPNSEEYIAGTNPTDNQSYLRLRAAPLNKSAGVVLRWLSAPGKTYQIETASSLVSRDWVVLAADLAGDGRVQEWVHTNVTANTRFYRIRLQP